MTWLELLARVDVPDWLAGLGTVLHEVFGGDAPDWPLKLHQVAARSAVIFLFGIVLIRLGKGRMLGRTTSIDVIVAVVLGSLLSRAVTGEASLSGTAVACTILVAGHWLLTWIAFRSHTFGKLFKGNQSLLVKDGVMQVDAMRHSHISEHDLMTYLRLAGVRDLSEVREAHKERNGEISVIRRRPPMTVDVAVQDGVQTVRIQID